MIHDGPSPKIINVPSRPSKLGVSQIKLSMFSETICYSRVPFRGITLDTQQKHPPLFLNV